MILTFKISYSVSICTLSIELFWLCVNGGVYVTCAAPWPVCCAAEVHIHYSIGPGPGPRVSFLLQTGLVGSGAPYGAGPGAAGHHRPWGPMGHLMMGPQTPASPHPLCGWQPESKWRPYVCLQSQGKSPEGSPLLLLHPLGSNAVLGHW